MTGSSSPCLIAAALGSMLPAGGCALQPWVKPYERESLADPIMNSAAQHLDRTSTANMSTTCVKARAAPPASRGPAVAATSLWRRLARLLGGFRRQPAGGRRRARRGAAATTWARPWPIVYSGGGVTASGPALLVRKNLGDRFSITGSYYVDFVSNASIDVVTTASPYRETRNAYGLGLELRGARLAAHRGCRHQPRAGLHRRRVNVDVAQDVFGGMTTVSLGLHARLGPGRQDGRGLLRHGRPLALPPRRDPGADAQLADERQLRGDLRRWLPGQSVPRGAGLRRGGARNASRARAAAGPSSCAPSATWASATWCAVPTATSGTTGASTPTPSSSATRAISARTGWPTRFVRYHMQDGALFFSDNATADTAYITRNRQLSSFNDVGLGLQPGLHGEDGAGPVQRRRDRRGRVA